MNRNNKHNKSQSPEAETLRGQKTIPDRFLLLIIGVLASLQLWYINHMPWSPIDEYAHMDYVEKLGEGKWPVINDYISPEIIHDIFSRHERHLAKQVSSPAELGLALYSYQAKHPPLYYSILTPVNLLMKKLDFSLFKRLQILRTFSYSLFVAGLLLLFPIARRMREIGYRIPMAAVSLAVIWALFFSTHERFGLGNNLLSPLLIHGAFLCLLRFRQSEDPSGLFALGLMAGLSVCGALTNLFLLPLIALPALPVFIRRFSLQTLGALLGGLLLPGLMLLWWHKGTLTQSPTADIINGLLHNLFRANQVGYNTFLQLLGHDLSTVDFIQPGWRWLWINLLLFAVNAGFLLAFRKRLLGPENRWILFLWGCLGYFLVLGFFLNRFVDDVVWVAYRHYLGFIGLHGLVLFSGFALVLPKPKNSPHCSRFAISNDYRRF